MYTCMCFTDIIRIHVFRIAIMYVTFLLIKKFTAIIIIIVCHLLLGGRADLIFVFFDPIGQALCKRTLNVVGEYMLLSVWIIQVPTFSSVTHINMFHLK